MNILQTFILLVAIATVGCVVPDTVGFDIGEVKSYQLLNKSGTSALYEIECPQIQDGRPIKLLELSGSHYDVGYAYGDLLGKEIIESYDTFLGSTFHNAI